MHVFLCRDVDGPTLRVRQNLPKLSLQGTSRELRRQKSIKMTVV
jgi:hypothetical protein